MLEWSVGCAYAGGGSQPPGLSDAPLNGQVLVARQGAWGDAAE